MGRVLVLGSINVDLLASVDRLPGAGETVAGNSLLTQLGGKGANQAVSAACAGAQSTLISAIGDDEAGAAMLASLTGYGVDTAAVARVSGPTGHALVVTSPRDNQIVVIAGANARVDAGIATGQAVVLGDVCLTQMETPPDAARAFFEQARNVGATTVLNVAPATMAALPLLPLIDILIVNESELALLSGKAIDDHSSDTTILSAISDSALAAVDTVIVTLGARGVAVARGGAIARTPGQLVEVIDTTGAGDCFCGYLAAGLARGDALESAVAEANVAASIAVQSLGAASSVPLRAQVVPAMEVC